MKRAILIIYILAMNALLSGCRGTLFSGHRDMEHLRPVQTIGLDAEGEAVTLSVSSGVGPEGAPPLVMRATASGIEEAAARLQDWAPEDELFYSHVRYILLGESLTDREGRGTVETVLDWVERSPAMRMDTPLLLIRGRAEDAVTGSLGGDTDATERLGSLERYRVSQGGSIPTLRQTAASLLERGYALCLTAELFPDEGTNFTEEESAAAIVPAGFALLREDGGGTSAVWLTQNESMGAELLTGTVAGKHVPAGNAVLELIRGGAEASGVWTGDGTLTGIYISCDLLAGVLEQDGEGTDPAGALEAAAGDWLTGAVGLSQALGCDFLGLEDAVRRTSPGRAAAGLDWAEAFPDLPVTIEVNAQIGRSYDLAG